MTKREAIQECKRLWKEIVESGLPKWGFLDSDTGKKWLDKRYQSACPLCEYDSQHKDNCTSCPLITQYGESCDNLDYEFDPAGFYEYVKGLKE